MRNTIVKLLMAIAMCFVIGTALVACAGADGKDGTNGKDGKDGKDGTVVTVSDDGYLVLDGVKTDFKIKGENGKDGVDGTNGTDGAPGLSAYQIWLQLPGNEGKSEEDFFASLKGEDANDCDHADPTAENSVIAVIDAEEFPETAQWIYWELAFHGGYYNDDDEWVEEDGLVLYNCLDCGESKLVKAVHHYWEAVEKDANCDLPAFVGNECLVCEKLEGEFSGEKLGHTYERNPDEFKVVYDTEYNVCVDGGFYAAYCTECGETAYEFRAAKGGHVVETWAITAPSTAANGVAVGKCVDCGDEVSVVLPKFGYDKYEEYYKKDEAPTCTLPGRAYYNYVTTAEDVEAYDLRNVHTIADVAYRTVDPNGHQLGYLDADGKLVAGSAKNYELWAEESYVGKDNAEDGAIPRFVKTDDGYAALAVYAFVDGVQFDKDSCGKTIKAWFVCANESCQNDPQTHGVVKVDVYANHKGNDNLDDATCNAPVVPSFDPCDVCGKKVEFDADDLYYAPHDYEFTATAAGPKVMVAGEWVLEWVNLEAKCNADCKIKVPVIDEVTGLQKVDPTTGEPVFKTETIKCWEQEDKNIGDDGYGYYTFTANNVKIIKDVASTCYELGYYVGEYVDADTQKKATITVNYTEYADHEVLLPDGSSITLEELYDGREYPLHTDAGIYKFVNDEIDYTDCGEVVPAYYFCPVCKEEGGKANNIVKLDVVVDHDIDVNDEESVVRNVAPTCTTLGEKDYECKNCDQVKTVYSDALGHAFEKIEEIKDDENYPVVAPTEANNGTAWLKGTCTRENCTADNNLVIVEVTLHAWNDDTCMKNEANADNDDYCGCYEKTIDTAAGCITEGAATYTYYVDVVELMDAAAGTADYRFEFKDVTDAEGHDEYNSLEDEVHLVIVEKEIGKGQFNEYDENGDIIASWDEVYFYYCEKCDSYVEVPLY